MTRLKTIALTTLGFIVALAALGLFASVGLVVLGALALLGLVAGIAAWLSTAMDAKPAPQDAKV